MALRFGKTKEQVANDNRGLDVRNQSKDVLTGYGKSPFVFTEQTARGLELKKSEKAAYRKFILNSNFYFKAFKITQIYIIKLSEQS